MEPLTSRPADELRPPVLRLRDPGDVIAAVPALLGFRPQRSLVAIALDGSRSRATTTARLDLPPPGLEQPAADALVAGLARAGGSSSLALAYTDDAAEAERCLTVVREALTTAGLPVRDALHVGARRWWSLACRDPRCCPPEGTPYDLTSSRVTAEMVFAGVAPHPDRADAVAPLAPVTGIARAVARHACDTVLAELVGEAAQRGSAAGDWACEAGVACVDRLLAACADPTSPEPDPRDVARLAMLLDLGEVRDHVYQQLAGDRLDAHRRLWLHVTRHAEPPMDAVPAALLAMTVWRQGGGALASAAVERAEQSDPDHPAVRLVGDVLRAAVPPAEIGRVLDVVAAAAGRRRPPGARAGR